MAEVSIGTETGVWAGAWLELGLELKAWAVAGTEAGVRAEAETEDVFNLISSVKRCLISMPLLLTFPPAKSSLVNSNFRRASLMQG